ncbi:hypothetical protein C4D60_Mb04t28880 [Musa balbisiana]|uniref:Uncharacterized protein n=1 Tax=Musa balbisiana TaxID=52838 RepID=A0A4S8KFK7_MUSBA|nr:hypothetical protein C4D60_Mb04t28880 [Musa balbisiana]
MAGGGVVMEVTTSSSTEPLLSSRASYAHSLSNVDDELKSFRSCLRWICIDQFDSLFILLGIFISIISHFVLSCAFTHCEYDVMVQLFLTSVAFSSSSRWTLTIF